MTTSSTSSVEDAPSSSEMPLIVLGDEYVIKLRGTDTGGTYTLIQATCRPGGGTPLHVHANEDECFLVLEGEFEFRLGDRSITARPGQAIHAPRNIPHSFTNRTEQPARLLVTALPAGAEKMFEELARLPAGPPDIPRVVEITGRYGVTLLPEG